MENIYFIKNKGAYMDNAYLHGYKDALELIKIHGNIDSAIKELELIIKIVEQIQETEKNYNKEL